jgi:hypothetical protein
MHSRGATMETHFYLAFNDKIVFLAIIATGFKVPLIYFLYGYSSARFLLSSSSSSSSSYSYSSYSSSSFFSFIADASITTRQNNSN